MVINGKQVLWCCWLFFLAMNGYKFCVNKTKCKCELNVFAGASLERF